MTQVKMHYERDTWIIKNVDITRNGEYIKADCRILTWSVEYIQKYLIVFGRKYTILRERYPFYKCSHYLQVYF